MGTKPHEEVTIEELCIACIAGDELDLHQQQVVCGAFLAALMAECEVRKMVNEIERRNKEGQLFGFVFLTGHGYMFQRGRPEVINGPYKPTIREAWEAFEGRQR